jgi:hypothetical protein
VVVCYLIQAAAENCLLHLLHHVENYPPTSGPSVMNALIPDPAIEDDVCHHYFAIEDTSIVTVVDQPEDRSCRIIVRDVTGRYAWDLVQFYNQTAEIASKPPMKIPVDYSPSTENITKSSYIPAAYFC